MRKQSRRPAVQLADHRLRFLLQVKMVQFLFFLGPKIQAYSLLLWLYYLVCVRPGWKPLKQVFTSCGSFYNLYLINKFNISSIRQSFVTVQPCLFYTWSDRNPGFYRKVAQLKHVHQKIPYHQKNFRIYIIYNVHIILSTVMGLYYKHMCPYIFFLFQFIYTSITY